MTTVPVTTALVSARRYWTPVTVGMGMVPPAATKVGAVGGAVGTLPADIAMTSSGRGRRPAGSAVPYRACSSANRLAAGTLVESTVIRAVGLALAIAVTPTGEVVTSQLKAKASGESLTV